MKYHTKNYEEVLKICINDEERRIVRRVSKMELDDIVYWQDIGKQIPFLIVVFIGAFIFRQHYVIHGAIIIYVWYGLKFNADRKYFQDVLYKRYGDKCAREFEEKKKAGLHPNLFIRR